MARYRKYDVKISLDERVRRLTPMEATGEGLWYYILSMPESSMIPGLCRVGRAAIAEARKWSLEGFDKAFGELFREGLAKADWEARVLWIPNVILYDPPSNPNVILGWSAHWDEIPDCEIKVEAWERFHAFFLEMAEAKRLETKKEGDPEAFLKAFLKACPNPSGKGLAKGSLNGMPNPRAPARIRKQEQDTGTGIEEKKPLVASPQKAADSPPPSVAVWIPIVGKIPKTLKNGPVREEPSGYREAGVTEARVQELTDLYPGVDVGLQLRRARDWCIRKPDRRKTYSGFQNFLTCWLGKEQNHGGNGGGPPPYRPRDDDGRRAAGGHDVLPPSRSIRMVDKLREYEERKAAEAAEAAAAAGEPST